MLPNFCPASTALCSTLSIPATALSLSPAISLRLSPNLSTPSFTFSIALNKSLSAFSISCGSSPAFSIACSNFLKAAAPLFPNASIISSSSLNTFLKDCACFFNCSICAFALSVLPVILLVSNLPKALSIATSKAFACFVASANLSKVSFLIPAENVDVFAFNLERFNSSSAASTIFCCSATF